MSKSRESLSNYENENVKQICDVEDHIGKNGKHKRMAKWMCTHCGSKFIACVEDIKKGHTKSCGCLRKETIKEYAKENNRKNNRERTRKQIFNGDKKFGMLTPISFADDHIESNGKHLSRILCKCDCGNKTIVRAADLISGKTTSCGCRTTSIAAQNINDALIALHIPFTKELRLPGCFNPETGVLLPFDFAILDENERVKALIEYQGEQHYKDVGEFGKLEREITDAIKKNYCIENEIPLQEIRYDEDEITALKKILKEIL